MIHHIGGLAPCCALCHWQLMSKPVPRAGGFLLMLTILVGLAGGVAVGSPITGVVIGTAIGIAVALLVWMGDARKQRR